MKTKLIFILTLFFFSCNPENIEKVADIKMEFSTEQIDGHKVMDVEIYKMDSSFMNPMKQYYLLVVYRMTDSQVKGNKEFINECDNVYDKVKYKWVNDSTLKYKLFNSENNLFENFSYVIINESSSRNSVEPADSF
jgi:hypothetical protein